MHAQSKPSVLTTKAPASVSLCPHHHAIRSFVQHGGHTDPMLRWELRRAAMNAADFLATDQGRYRREVAGNVIRYLPLPPAPTVPRPGEDGEPQAMSETWFWVGVALLFAGSLLIGFLQKAGLL